MKDLFQLPARYVKKITHVERKLSALHATTEKSHHKAAILAFSKPTKIQSDDVSNKHGTHMKEDAPMSTHDLYIGSVSSDNTTDGMHQCIFSHRRHLRST